MPYDYICVVNHARLPTSLYPPQKKDASGKDPKISEADPFHFNEGRFIKGELDTAPTRMLKNLMRNVSKSMAQTDCEVTLLRGSNELLCVEVVML